jgi:hypothetical protein
MEDKIIKTLESLREVQPKEAFARETFARVTMHEQKVSWNGHIRRILWQEVKIGIAFAGTAAIAIVAIVVVNINSTDSLAGKNTLNDTHLQQEAHSLQFDIELGEAKYFAESTDEISVALQKIAGDDTGEVTQ